MILISISLTTMKVKQLFTYLLAIHAASVGNLFVSCTYFSIG